MSWPGWSDVAAAMCHGIAAVVGLLVLISVGCCLVRRSSRVWTLVVVLTGLLVTLTGTQTMPRSSYVVAATCQAVGILVALFGLCSVLTRFRSPRPSRVQDTPGSLQVGRTPNGKRTLLRPLCVAVNRAGSQLRCVTVCQGFVTDYSSLPLGTRWLVNWSRVDVAGVVHDYLYRNGTQLGFSRAEADRIWRWVASAGRRRALCHQAWIGWLALRLCGFGYR